MLVVDSCAKSAAIASSPARVQLPIPSSTARARILSFPLQSPGRPIPSLTVAMSPQSEQASHTAQLEEDVVAQHHHHLNGLSKSAPQEHAAVAASPKLLTLVIVDQDGRVLLGLKKRGFGEGYYNGFGGKVESGETLEEAAHRELQEEAGIITEKMLKRGILTFHFDDKPQPWEVHVFHVSDFIGEPHETDEMFPIWFSHADIPFEKMWKDDEIWYPHFLAGRLFKGEFYFCDTHHLVSHSLHVVQAL